MEKLLIVGLISPGLYLMIPSEGFHLPASHPESYSYKTPNSAMEKAGIDRYPFSSVRYRIESAPVVSGHGYTLEAYHERPQNPLNQVTESANAIGNNRSHLAIGLGGVVSSYVSESGAYVDAFWLRPGNGGWYLIIGRGDDIGITYFRFVNGSIKYASLGYLPVDHYMPVDEILSAVYSYEPSVDSSDLDNYYYYNTFWVDSAQPGVIPGNLTGKILSAVSPTAGHDSGKIGFDLISQFKITDVNLPAFFIDAPKFGSSTKDALNSLRRFFKADDIKSSAKNLSKANLAYQYGDRLTVADGRALIDSVDKVRSLAFEHKPITAKSKDVVAINLPGATGVDILRYTATASPADPLSRGVYWLSQVANSSNVWDLIPFSFVVDWFLNVGDYLASEDAKVLNCTLKYDRILTSRLLKLELNQFELEGSLLSGEFISFNRQAVDKVPEPDIDLQASLPRPAQWINGTSLLTSLLIK